MGMAQAGGGWQRGRLGAARGRRGMMTKMGGKQRRNSQPSTGMAGATSDKVNDDAMAQQARKTMTMATARQDTTTTMMVTDVVNNDNDNEGNNASSTTSHKGDNCNHNDDGKDTCTSTAMTPVHRRWRQHSQ